MKLNLRRSYKKRILKQLNEVMLQPLFTNISWNMDFMSDGLLFGDSFRSFNIIDEYNREAFHITLYRGILSVRVIRELDKVSECCRVPEKIRVDNDPEFLAQVMKGWCKNHEIDLTYIEKGKPNRNGYVERFNRIYCEVILEQAWLTPAWKWIYNNECPHDSIGNMPPQKFLENQIE